MGWSGVRTPHTLPSSGPMDWVASANEARLAPDGDVLSTLAQPRYRLDRIQQFLAASPQHDLDGFKRLQLDLYSRQAERLTPVFLGLLEEGPLRRALAAWDRRYDIDRVGAHAFSSVYQRALHALAPELGGAWFSRMLARSELSVWWADGLDRVLYDLESHPARRARVAAAVNVLADLRPAPWGETQRFELRHMMLGGLPHALGFDRGPHPLPGSIATVCQGNLVPLGDTQVAVGPAYRFVTDLGEDAAYTALPGGIDEGPWSPTYDRWLAPYLSGAYHRLEPPPL